MRFDLSVGISDLRSNGCGYKELRAVGVLSGVGHAESASLGVLQFEVLVREFGSVDGFSTRA